MLMNARLFAFAAATLASTAVGCAAETSALVEGATTEDDLTRAECRGPKGETEAACRVEGVVERQVTGEMDPFVVGDACVTFVKVGARRYGLVQEIDACPNEAMFANGNVRASFSKGDITLASRERSKVLKDFAPGVTYYEFSGALRVQAPPPPSTLAAFEALSGEEQFELLYEVRQDFGVLRPGFTEKEIRIVDELDGDAERQALAEYFAARTEARQNGGDTPRVVAIQNGGTTWAYAIHSGGRSYGNWWRTVVFDRSFDEIGGFGGSD